jgi:hypothetical protein
MNKVRGLPIPSAESLDALLGFQLHCPLFKLLREFHEFTGDLPVCGLTGEMTAPTGMHPEIFGLLSRLVGVLGHEPMNAPVDINIPEALASEGISAMRKRMASRRTLP